MKHLRLSLATLLLVMALTICTFAGCAAPGEQPPVGTTISGNTPNEPETQSPKQCVRFGFSSTLASSSVDYNIEIVEYDAHGNPEKVTDVNTGMKYGELPTLFQNEYDDSGKLIKTNLISIANQLGVPKYYTYDDSGKLINEIFVVPDIVAYGATYQQTYAYDANGALESASFYLNFPENDMLMCKTLYGSFGEVVEEQLPGEAILTFEYNQLGNVTLVKEYGPDDMQHATVVATREFTYDASNRLTAYRKISAGTGEVEIEHKWEYDTNGNCTLFYANERERVEYAYDANGNCTKVIEWDLYNRPTTGYPGAPSDEGAVSGTESADQTPEHPDWEGKWEPGRETVYCYDAQNRVIEKTGHMDEPAVNLYQYVYDDKGLMATETGLRNRQGGTMSVSTTLTLTYDDKGNVTSMVYFHIGGPNSFEQTEVSEIEYTDAGLISRLVQKVVDKDGNTVEFGEYRATYAFENGLYRMAVKGYDANGNEIPVDAG